MNNPIQIFSKTMRKAATWSPIFNTLINLSKYNLRILTYHGISPLSLSIHEFEKQLQLIKKIFDCYWVCEIPYLLKKTNRTKPRLILTFDDGLKNHLINAMPLLDKYGIKATFFVPVGLVENREMLWNHEIRCLLSLMENNDLPEGIGPFHETEDRRFKEIGEYIERLKILDISERIRIMDSLKRKRKTSKFHPWMLEEFQLMNIDDLQNISDLVEIGSHTLTHPILTSISDEQLYIEIRESRTRLEKIIGKPVLSFCYPNGIYNEKIVKIVEETYSIAVSTDEGLVKAGDRMSILKRIPAGKNIEEFLVRLISPTS